MRREQRHGVAVMSDTSFGSGLSFGPADAGEVGTDVMPTVPGAVGPTSLGGAPLANPDGSLFQPVAAPEPVRLAPPDPGTAPPVSMPSFGDGLRKIIPGPNYRAPDPEQSALDQTADTLQQRIKRANEVATNPLLQLFNPEGVQKARDFVPQATEMLQKIKAQKSAIQAGRTQAETLGLAPGEVADEATVADRVTVAQAKALKGDLNAFKGLQAVDPKAAEAIQDRVYETTAGHLTKAQYAFDSLSGMQNQGQYAAKINQLRKDGTLADLEALGLKVPGSFDQFNNLRGPTAKVLREARVSMDTIRQKLEERNTYQPMEEKEAKTYNGRLTTAFGDQITNGTWSRNAAAGTRGLIVNGAADPRELGKSFTLASPEQRKAIKEEFDGAVPKADLDKYREFSRTYKLATEDAKGNKVTDGKINTNPNVQQGIAEGLASMLRGGHGGANVGLLQIELAKRGWAQGAIDGLVSNYNGALNTLFKNANDEGKPYLSQNTQKQIRDVMDVLKTYNDKSIDDRAASIAHRAGALGLDSSVLGLGKNEAGSIADALEQGRIAQIERMLPNHQAIGGGDGVFQLGAQRPGTNAVQPPQGASPPTTQLPGAPALATPVQQATQPGGPAPAPGGPNPAGPNPAGAGVAPPKPTLIAGQQVAIPLPAGASPEYAARTQRIESGKEKDPWKAGTERSSASGAFQFINSTWEENKPAGAPARAKDATPAQQAEAFATLTAKNAAALAAAKIPVDDTSLYVTHNLGVGAGPKLLQAGPNADARKVVGEAAARNNPLFFKGRPTVATVLERYQKEMLGDNPAALSTTGGPASVEDRARQILDITDQAPGTLQGLFSSTPPDKFAGDKIATPDERANSPVTQNLPAIASTVGGVAGFAAGGPAGGVAGGAAGGGAGQAIKDYLQGRAQQPKEIAKEAALGGVLGVSSAGRPVLAAGARMVGAGAVEAADKAIEGGDASDIADAGGKGVLAAAGGEAFGRALGMAGHKLFTMFTPDAQAAVRTAAKELHDAGEVLKKEAPTITKADGTSAPNPTYEAAKAVKEKAETAIKEMMPGAKPDEVAYAHKATAEKVPAQEAKVTRPAAVEEQRIGEGYEQLRNEIGERGVGTLKPTPKLPDGPRAAVENKQVSAKHAELAERTEAAITAPAKDWKEKWTQLAAARSELLEAERDALAATTGGKSREAKDMRVLADSVRKQQEKAAKYVFGEKDGEAFMSRLKVLDVRYRNLMEATGNGDLMKAAAMKGEAGRDIDRKFRAFAHDDAQAVEAWGLMRKHSGGDPEKTVPWTVVLEGIPVVKHLKIAVLADMLRKASQERAAGMPVKFEDLVKAQDAITNRAVRDVTGTAAQRGAVMGSEQQPQQQ